MRYRTLPQALVLGEPPPFSRDDPPASEEACRLHIQAARHALRPRRLPVATTLLDTGSEARVFATTRPHTVVRVGRDPVSEMSLLDPDVRAGVVPVQAMVVSPSVVVTWKERVDPWVEGFLLRRMPQDEAASILGALCHLWDRPFAAARVLRSRPETRGLAQAILAGLSTRDLDLTSNLGVTQDGRVVAYDL